jgi:hypothetical protein
VCGRVRVRVRRCGCVGFACECACVLYNTPCMVLENEKAITLAGSPLRLMMVMQNHHEKARAKNERSLKKKAKKKGFSANNGHVSARRRSRSRNAFSWATLCLNAQLSRSAPKHNQHVSPERREGKASFRAQNQTSSRSRSKTQSVSVHRLCAQCTCSGTVLWVRVLCFGVHACLCVESVREWLRRSGIDC